MSYCPDCGNTGIDIDGKPCHCRMDVTSFYESVSCLDIPEQYHGVRFNKLLVPKDMHEAYAELLEKLHHEITLCELKKNILIASPIKHSKTIMAYSAMEELFRTGVETFPIYDVLEIKRILTDMDLSRKQLYSVDNPDSLLTVPYLFVHIPRSLSWEMYDTIAVILNRRVRRNGYTIFLFDGTWPQLISQDRNGLLTELSGDGTYGTIKVESWNPIATSNVEIQIPDNIG